MNWLSKHLEISYRTQSPITPMEGLRGIAVFLVFLVHYSTFAEPFVPQNSFISSIHKFIFSIGNVGVDLFFVLSGYLIYGTLIKKKQPFGPYLLRRIKRIYPTFIFVFLIYLCLSYIFPNESKLPEISFGKAIYIVQNLLLLPGIFKIEPLIMVAWSLSYEFFYYLLIPILLFLLNLRKWKLKSRISFWLVISIFGFLLGDYYANNFRLIMFVSGILLFEFMSLDSLKFPRFSGLFGLVISLLLFGYFSSISLDNKIIKLMLFISFFIVCFESFTRKNGSAMVFNYRPMRWLGNMSYSYYLIHGITLKALFLIFEKANGLIISGGDYMYLYMWIPVFVITLITSFILFIFVEKPLSIAR